VDQKHCIFLLVLTVQCGSETLDKRPVEFFLLLFCVRVLGLAAPCRGEKKEEARGGAGEEEGGEAA
jgi:hypothetical protein